MPNYRRTWVSGSTYFFTVAIAERSKSLLVDRIDDLRDAFRAAYEARPFTIDAKKGVRFTSLEVNLTPFQQRMGRGRSGSMRS